MSKGMFSDESCCEITLAIGAGDDSVEEFCRSAVLNFTREEIQEQLDRSDIEDFYREILERELRKENRPVD